MNTIGMLMMIVSYSAIIILVSYCFFRVLTTPGTSQTEHAPLEIDTHDLNSNGD